MPRAIVFVTSVSAEMASRIGASTGSASGLSMPRNYLPSAAPNRIRVRGAPGHIATDMTPASGLYDKRIADGLVPRGDGAAEDVGRAVAALVRGDVAYYGTLQR